MKSLPVAKYNVYEGRTALIFSWTEAVQASFVGVLMMSFHDCRPSYKYHEEEVMALYIETLTGTTFEVTVSPYDTVMTIKSKIQRVEGIPVSQQHLLYNLQELEDSALLIDCALHNGATVKLVLSMRGGPISTVRRILPLDDAAWKELVHFNRDELLEDLPPGCRMAILVFREGDQLNLLRVLENLDGSYSPLSESWSRSSVSNLFDDDDSDECNKRLEENTITMEKVNELKNKLEELSIQRRSHNKVLDRVDSSVEEINKPSVSTHRSPVTTVTGVSSRQHEVNKRRRSVLHLPPLRTAVHDTDDDDDTPAICKSRTEFTRVPVLPNITPHASPEVSPRIAILDSEIEPIGVAGSQVLLDESRPKTSPDHLTSRQLCEILSEASRHRHAVLRTHCSAPHTVKSLRPSTSDVDIEPLWGNSSRPLPPSVRKHFHFKLPHNDKPVPSSSERSDCVSTASRESELPIRSSFSNSPFSRTEGSQLNNATAYEGSSTTKSSKSVIKPLKNVFPGGSKDSVNNSLLYNNSKSGRYPVNPFLPKPNLSPNLVGRSSRFVATPLSSINILRNSETAKSIIGETSTTSRRKAKIFISSVTTAGLTGKDNNILIKNSTTSSSAGDSKFDVEGESSSLEVNNLIGGDPSQVGTSHPSVSPKKKENRNRCAQCRKRLTLTNSYTCRCGHLFCSSHRYSEVHNCTYDYKKEGRKLLQQANPVVTAPKLPKI